MAPATGNLSNIKLVTGTSGNLKELQELFVDTINAVCCIDYNASQIEAWTSGINNEDRWKEIVNRQYLLVAKLDETIIEFFH